MARIRRAPPLRSGEESDSSDDEDIIEYYIFITIADFILGFHTWTNPSFNERSAREIQHLSRQLLVSRSDSQQPKLADEPLPRH